MRTIERRILQRVRTIMSKLMELQDIERQNGTSILPCSTEGYIQDLTEIVMEIE